jgi:hypothetical protein
MVIPGFNAPLSIASVTICFAALSFTLPPVCYDGIFCHTWVLVFAFDKDVVSANFGQ